MIPKIITEEQIGKLVEALGDSFSIADPQVRERVKREMLAKAAQDGFKDFTFAYVASYQPNPAINGKNIAEVTQTVQQKTDLNSQTEQAIEILQGGGAQMVLRKMSEEDVERIFRQPFTMVASDAGVQDVNSASIPHPRGFGNNARVLAVYTREKRFANGCRSSDCARARSR